MTRPEMEAMDSGDLVGNAMGGSLSLEEMQLAHELIAARGDSELASTLQRLIDGWRQPTP